MEYHTINYPTVKEIKDPHILYTISEVTNEPQILVRQAKDLLEIFIHNYCESKEAKTELAHEALRDPHLIDTLVQSTFSKLHEAMLMFDEINEAEGEKSDENKLS